MTRIAQAFLPTKWQEYACSRFASDRTPWCKLSLFE